MNFSGYHHLKKLFNGENNQSFTLLVSRADLNSMTFLLKNLPSESTNNNNTSNRMLAIRMGPETKKDMNHAINEGKSYLEMDEIMNLDMFWAQDKKIDDYNRFALFIDSDYHDAITAAYISTSLVVPIKVVKEKSWIWGEYDHFVVGRPLTRLEFLEKMKEDGIFNSQSQNLFSRMLSKYISLNINPNLILQLTSHLTIIPGLYLMYYGATLSGNYTILSTHIFGNLCSMIHHILEADMMDDDELLGVEDTVWRLIGNINVIVGISMVFLEPLFSLLNLTTIHVSLINAGLLVVMCLCNFIPDLEYVGKGLLAGSIASLLVMLGYNYQEYIASPFFIHMIGGILSMIVGFYFQIKGEMDKEEAEDDVNTDFEYRLEINHWLWHIMSGISISLLEYSFICMALI